MLLLLYFCDMREIKRLLHRRKREYLKAIKKKEYIVIKKEEDIWLHLGSRIYLKELKGPQHPSKIEFLKLHLIRMISYFKV